MENQIRNTAQEEPETAETGAPKEAPGLVKATDFSFYLDRDHLPRLVPYFAFFVVLAALYIANSHAAEKMVRKSDKMAKEIKELRAEYISIKSDLMYRSKQSQIARRLESAGLKELRVPPKRIIYSEKDER